MVFKNGAPTEGYPMSADAIQAELTNGNLNGFDLIHYQGKWQPLQDFWQLPPAEDTSVKENDDAEELATILEEMLPLEGYIDLPASLSSDVNRQKRAKESKYRQRIFLPKHWSAAPWASNGMYKMRKMALHHSWIFLIGIPILAMLFMLTTYSCNRLVGRTSCIHIFNFTGSTTAMDIPKIFRNDISIPPGKSALTDIALPMPMDVSVHINKLPLNQAVRMVPNYDIIVNINGAALFDVFKNYRDIDNYTFNSYESLRLIRQIANRENPTAALKLVAELHQNFAREFYVETINDEVISGEQYNLGKLDLSYGKRNTPSKFNANNNDICFSGIQNFDFANGSIAFTHRKPYNNCCLTFDSNATIVPDPALPNVAIGNDTVTFSATITGDKAMKIRLDFAGKYYRPVGKTVKTEVTWRYEADYNDGAWSNCRWIYSFDTVEGRKRDIAVPVR